jgi:molybdenum cofactor synthesis domain-containing protein
MPRQEAIKIILQNTAPIQRTQKVTIDNAVDRVLASDIKADLNVPPFNRSSMDGFALKAADTFGASQFNPKTLKLKAVQHAGDVYKGSISEGECVQVATGSPIPNGSDSVVMVEYTRIKGDQVEILRPSYPGANISPEGEDIKKGETILKAGEPLTIAKVGALAALNIISTDVFEKPKVAVFSTGTEIKPLGVELAPGQIYDINSYTLSSVISANGCIAERKGIIPDNEDQMKNAIKDSTNYDLGVFSGGSSVGTRDIFFDVVEKLGEVLFHGVQVKPGKPTLFGLVENIPIFGMPGYPTSCLSNAYVFLAPCLRVLARLPEIAPRTVKAKMGSRFVSSSGREQFLTVKVADGVANVVFKKSGAITSMAEADGYIVLPVNLDVIEEGEEVEVTILN